MRKLAVLVSLVIIAGGGAFYYLNRDRIRSASDFLAVAREQFDGFSGGSRDAQFSPPVSRSGETIRIATFNIQVLGQTKLSKPHVMDLLSRIIRRFDIVAIQEVRSQDQSILPQFVDLIN